MKDPVRWREANSEADPEMRALLASDEAETPSSNERKRIWAGLAPHIQILPVPPPVAPVASMAATGTGALLGKITLGVVLVTAVGAGVQVARSRRPTAKPTPTVSVPGPALTKAAEPVVLPIAEPMVPATPAPAAKPVGHRTKPVAPMLAPAKAVEVPEPPTVVSAPVVLNNELLEEGRRLARARAALRVHDPDGALKLLQSESAGSAGLAQEREALTIEALWSRPSSRAEAERRARAFMVAYPDSPYRARIKALVLGDR